LHYFPEKKGVNNLTSESESERSDSESQRKAFANQHNWFKRHLGKIASGGTLTGTIMALPAIAQAQVAEFVSASSINGVTSVQTLANGTASMTMANGSVISIPAGQFSVLAGGQVMVAPQIAQLAAQAMAAGANLANKDNARALELASSSLRLNRSHTSTLRIKAVAEWRLGKTDDARKTLAKLLKKQPNFTVSWWRQSSPAADYEMGRAFARSLKELGVPE
jgi:tetratricopeptide (TPR) repeat protein